MIHFTTLTKVFLMFLFLLTCHLSYAQFPSEQPKEKSEFWKRVHFGGGIGMSFGRNITNLSLDPGAIYDFNRYFSGGVAIQGSYLKVKNQYDSWIYGGSLLGLYNPFKWIQFSAELEQLRVNTEYQLDNNLTFDDDFWNTALFLGAGYRTGYMTIGVRYNVLFNEKQRMYPDSIIPFVRVYF